MMFFSPSSNNDDVARLRRRIGNIFDEYDQGEPQSREHAGPASAATYEHPHFHPVHPRVASRQPHYVSTRSPYAYASPAAGPQDERGSGWVLKPVPRDTRREESSQATSGQPRFRLFIRDPSEEKQGRAGGMSQQERQKQLEQQRKQQMHMARALFGDRAHIEEEDEDEEEQNEDEQSGKVEKSSDKPEEEQNEENELSQRILEELIRNLAGQKTSNESAGVQQAQMQNLPSSLPGFGSSVSSSSSAPAGHQLLFTTDAAGNPVFYRVPSVASASEEDFAKPAEALPAESHKRQAPSSFTKSSASLHLPMDIWEESDAYIIEVDMPGIQKSDVKLSVDDGTLMISAERHKIARKEDKKDESEENVQVSSIDASKSSFLMNERIFGQLSRSIELPKDVDTGNITAKFDESLSVLRVALQKKSDVSKQFISID